MFDFLNTKKMKKRFEDIPVPFVAPKAAKLSDVDLLKKIFSKQIKYILPEMHVTEIFSPDIRFISNPALFFVNGRYYFTPTFVYNKRILNLDGFVSKAVLNLTIGNSRFDDKVFTFYLESAKPVEYNNIGCGMDRRSFSMYTIYNGEKIHATISLINFGCGKFVKSPYWHKPQLPEYHNVTESAIIPCTKTEFYTSKAAPFDKDLVMFDIQDIPPYFDNKTSYWIGKEVDSTENGSMLFKSAEFADIIVEDGVVWERIGEFKIVESVGSRPNAYIDYRTSYETGFGTKSFKTIQKCVPIIIANRRYSGYCYYPEYNQDPHDKEEKTRQLVSLALVYRKEEDK